MKVKNILFKIAYLSSALPKILAAWPDVKDRVRAIAKTDPVVSAFVNDVDELYDVMAKRVR